MFCVNSDHDVGSTKEAMSYPSNRAKARLLGALGQSLALGPLCHRQPAPYDALGVTAGNDMKIQEAVQPDGPLDGTTAQLS